MMSWIKSIFSKTEVKPKGRTYLTKELVKDLEKKIGVYNIDYITDYYQISRGTYFVIKSGKHRYSTRNEDVRV